ncbi:MAG: Uma2 family endonuclease [Cytophagia bacterium]|nr:MAG: Uma2 family endonuclease [Cytophagales bacterium]TAG19591.1 MAG: Uma2 family endonuclease [Cytophagales bacterium]TAG38802.1 MAG: Uma2 family endonuclease [Cytophagia bacterium]
METTSFDLIEEFQTEDISGSPHRSLNHSRIINRFCVALDQFDSEFDTFPELELELTTGKCKPDLCIYKNLPIDWYNDTIFFTQAPIVAVEILSPKQALSELTDKAFKQYFPAGVQVVWIIIPTFRTTHILLPNGELIILSSSALLKDPVTGVEVNLKSIFR